MELPWTYAEDERIKICEKVPVGTLPTKRPFISGTLLDQLPFKTVDEAVLAA